MDIRPQPQSLHVAEFIAHKHQITGQQMHHPALLLVNDRDPDTGVLHHLHYNGVKQDAVDELLKRYVIVPCVWNGMSSRTYNRLAQVKKVDEGDEFEIRQKWNHMLRSQALETKKLGLEFDRSRMEEPDTDNCRTGIVRALKSCGIEIKSDTFIEEAGTKHPSTKVDPTFKPIARPADIFDFIEKLEEFRAETKLLSKQLPIPIQSQVFVGAVDLMFE